MMDPSYPSSRLSLPQYGVIPLLLCAGFQPLYCTQLLNPKPIYLLDRAAWVEIFGDKNIARAKQRDNHRKAIENYLAALQRPHTQLSQRELTTSHLQVKGSWFPSSVVNR
ncbi:hypothetical protein AMECASPLE_002724 [Ameca splendens]|uniref:Uncharacterized protein n=1 Tax=Ameca splendens TaxID=208324 RepID=A0ABV0Y9R6_9TELE